MNKILIEPIITRRLLNSLDFKVFNRHEYEAFSEVKHPKPLIAYTSVKILGKEFDSIVILDGDECELYIDGYDPAIEYCKNVKELE